MTTAEESSRKSFTCPSCGGTQNFSPTTGNLACLYCSAEVELDQEKVEIVENDFDQWAAEWKSHTPSDTAKPSENEGEEEFPSELQVSCQSCGATTTFEADTHAQNCPFCGTPLEQNQAHLAKFWEPNYIIPFRVAQRECSDRFKNWMKRKWFAPNQAKHISIGTQRFAGMYLPYWTYDAQVHADYVGERGDEYTTTDSDGNTHTRTSWTTVSGAVDHFFDDIRIPAVDSVAPNILARVHDWSQKDYQPFRHAYMAGFRAQIYTIDFVQGYEKAAKVIEQKMDSLVRDDIGGDDQRVHKMDLTIENRKFKLLVLPFWLASYKYKEKVYQVVVNGRTGKLYGTSPVSTWKVIFAIVLVCLVLWGLYYLSENF